MNPVRAGTVHLPEEYQWSSYRDYIGYPSSGLVDTSDTLSHFSEDPDRAMTRYKGFVELGIEETDSPFKDLRAEIVLGREVFVEERIKAIIRDKGADRELPAFGKASHQGFDRTGH